MSPNDSPVLGGRPAPEPTPEQREHSLALIAAVTRQFDALRAIDIAGNAVETARGLLHHAEAEDDIATAAIKLAAHVDGTPEQLARRTREHVERALRCLTGDRWRAEAPMAVDGPLR